MWPVHLSIGWCLTKLGEIVEFGDEYGLQALLGGGVSPNDLEQAPTGPTAPPDCDSMVGLDTMRNRVRG